MRELIDIVAFYEIHKNKKSFLIISVNFAMREYLSGYGFKATRTNTQTLMDMRTPLSGNEVFLNGLLVD